MLEDRGWLGDREGVFFFLGVVCLWKVLESIIVVFFGVEGILRRWRCVYIGEGSF